MKRQTENGAQRLRSPIPVARIVLALMLVLPCFAAVLAPTIAFAQANAGLTGTITDSTGAVVPNAKITIVNLETAVKTELTSGSAGNYTVKGLNPGKYDLTVEAAGFKKGVQKSVNVEVSTMSTIDVSLATGSTTDSVEVVASEIALNTTQPQLGSTIEPEIVAVMPVVVSGRGRQIDSLQFLAPGTQGDTFSHRVGGGVDFEQEIVYNGIPVPQPETEGYSTNFNPPFEMVQEARVERSTFAAQFGLGQGALTYNMASGTNTFHGDAFEINRNSLFDANEFFNHPYWNASNTRNKPPVDHENNYGFTIGGPVRIPHVYNGKDKTFFHYSQEWFKQNQMNTNAGTVPTMQERNGDFSDFVDGNGKLIPIYDPVDGTQFHCGGVLNVICPDRISANSKFFIPWIPKPDHATLQRNKDYVPYPNPNIQHNWGFTADQTITASQSVHFSMWHNSFHNQGFDQDPITTDPTSPLYSIRDYPARGSGYLLNYTNAFTSHLAMTFGAGWIGEINNQFNVSHQKSAFPAIANSTVPVNVQFDGNYNPSNWGTDGANTGSVNRKLGVAVVNNWLWTKGRHAINAGVELRRSLQDDNEEQQAGGKFKFSYRQTSDAASGFSGDHGSSFASFLLGLPDSVARVNSQELKLRNWDYSPYFQDDLKITPKLTMNLGIRWDIQVPFTEVNNNVVFFNPTGHDAHYGSLPGDVSKLGSCTGCSGSDRAADIHWGHFGPRIGMAYKINDKSVIQGGFAIAFLNGGAYEYGTNKVAVNYGNLLVGSYNRGSLGNNKSSFGDGTGWDHNVMPDPPHQAFNTALGAGTTIYALDKKHDGFAPYAQQWNLNYQRELPYNMMLTAAFVGNRVIHLPSRLNWLDQTDPKYMALGSKLTDTFKPGDTQVDGVSVPYANFVADFGGGATVQQALNPFPQYYYISNNFEGSGTTYYQSAQIEVEKRFSSGISFLVGYTLSHMMDNMASGFSSFANPGINKYNQKPEYTVSSSDEPQTLKVSGTYELPIGPHKKFLNNHGVTGQILGGWQIAWILNEQAGQAFGPGQDGSPTPNLNGTSYRPIRTSAKLGTGSYNRARDYFLKGVKAPLFNTDAFTPAAPYVLSTTNRNFGEMRRQANLSESAAINKKFFLGEHLKANLKLDYFNVLNRVIFNDADNNISHASTTYGLVTGHGTNNSPRRGQITFNLEF